METKHYIKTCTKYIIFAGIIYAILKYIPTKKLSTTEILISTTVILIGIYSIDSMTMSKKKESMTNSNAPSRIFDLDMDIDLDFNKKHNVKENLSDVQTEDEDDSVVEEDVSDAIDIDGVQEEIQKINPESKIKLKEVHEHEDIKKKVISEASDVDVENLEEKKKEIMEKIKNSDDIDEILKYKEEHKLIEEKIKNHKMKAKERLDKKKDSKGVNCDVEVAKMRKEMQETIKKLREELNTKESGPFNKRLAKKYMTHLTADLLNKQILDKDDVENLNAKIISGTITHEEAIKKLESLRSIGVPKDVSKPKDRTNDMKYSDLPADFYEPIGDKIANQWDNDYSILNTNKWTVPQSRPPVCISNNGPCKVCPTNTDGYPTSLKEWDNSRYVSNMKINKDWALDQVDSS